eukprot:gnl/TRDRNA2_/TRDRNA2_203071_c0_seq1.p1 gnl/TRDRNA2_/TRDRNA2_203071_c0~~gnl/TRDRNA2_/TRDRNA2_203071_c0_seq1.p1  ORF type:complete len:201 (-),score=18.13 gnl/TRDRNA2_/TRDRNA2_203071_c0_seq1:34-636(-)
MSSTPTLRLIIRPLSSRVTTWRGGVDDSEAGEVRVGDYIPVGLEPSEEDMHHEQPSAKAKRSQGECEGKSCGCFRGEGRRLTWEVQGWDVPRDLARGDCLTSAAFGVAGVSPLRLLLYPNGEPLTAEGWCAAGLLSESQEKAKRKFEVFMNGRSSGANVLLGKTLTCDFRRPDTSHGGGLSIDMKVHENLLWKASAIKMI